ncbi:MAG: hypothetical protein ABI779_11660, partial [Acidobacteriota bacterium]
MPTASILTGSWGFLALVFGGLTLYWLLALMMDAIRSSTRTALLLAAAIAGCIAAAGDYFLRAGTLDLPGRLALLLSWILTWKVVTRAQPEGTLFGADWRIAALVLAVGASFLPGLWIPWLAVCLGPLHGWTHHTSLPFRFVGLHAAVHCAELVLMTLGMAVFDWTAVRWALSLSLYASHFVVPAISKVQLGVRAAEHSREDAPTERPHVPKAGPTSAGGRAAHGLEWVIVNRTSCIIANAWVWGWRMPGLKMARLLWSVGRRHERLINTVVLLIEFAPLLGILWPAFLPVSLFLALVFLVLVFVGTGICFWEYAVLTT